jgi:hypothetical protein
LGGLRFDVFEGGGGWVHVGVEEGGALCVRFWGICCGVGLGFVSGLWAYKAA